MEAIRSWPYPRVGIQDREAARRQQLQLVHHHPAVLGVRTAVDIQDQRAVSAGPGGRRTEQPAVDLSLRARRQHLFRFRQRDALQQAVIAPGDPLESGCRPVEIEQLDIARSRGDAHHRGKPPAGAVQREGRDLAAESGGQVLQ
jgi:hypothetical protein